jgi:diaminohydroxyphosphoribosylaminopyrimidine deaminase / 5-amino-6-(5-phosphoribosylamino)uracil reductase
MNDFRPSPRSRAEDRRFMELALRLARRGLGYTEPNPLVGAVAVKSGRIIGCGWHRAFGAEHAEAMALRDVDASGATLYVTLEPCDHQGKTPPCSELIISRRVARVVAAMTDPNPLVDGRGIARLRDCGVAVETGLLADRAGRLNRHYLKALGERRPWFAIRAGMSLDGKLTDRNGASRWMTSPELRNLSHGLRGEFSAIMAGAGTARADDPQLTLREPGWEGKKLARIVLDSRNTLPDDLAIFRESERFPLILFSSRQAVDRRVRAARHFFVPEDDLGLSLPAISAILLEQGITSVLVEGGGKLIGSFLTRRLFDEAVLFVAPRLVGSTSAVQLWAEGATELAASCELDVEERHELGSGSVLRGVRRCSPASC